MSFEKVIIRILNGLSSQCISKKLNLKDKLSDIRNSDDDINDTLLFSTKLSDGGYAKIERENEKNYRLKEIITINNNQYILYLKLNSYWKILNDNCKLDYGCTMSFDGIKRANKRAFIMKDCELTKNVVEEYMKAKLKFESKNDWIMKTNLFFSSDDNVKNFVDMGLSVESLSKKNENFDDEIKSVYEFKEVRKVLIKFREHLEPTEEFIKEIKDAINSDNPEKEFRKIMEEYGQFIPTEIILGGRVYFKNSVKESIKGSAITSTEPSKVEIEYESGNLGGKSKFYNFNHMKILGGNHPESENFNEKYWMDSLNDYNNWDCIKFLNPKCIFKLLPKDICKQIIFSVGKKILHVDYEHHIFTFNNYISRCIPYSILTIIQNKDADCDIFATVENSKDGVINCQILRPEKEEPEFLIQYIQKENDIKLYIKYMAIGYDTEFKYIYSDDKRVELRKFVYDTENCEFDSIPIQRELVSMISNGNPFFGFPILNNLNSSNDSLVIGHNFRKTLNNEFKVDLFSYCTKTHRYVKLPKFTFCTFVILNNNAINTPFEFKRWGKPFINRENFRLIFPSLYLLNRDDYSPIFLNQTEKQINIEYVDCNCNKTCFICNNKTKRISKNDQISCALFNLRKFRYFN
jgi:hypothetical protein